MGIVRWDIQATDIDGFDRSKQIKPYAGPIPPNGMYLWRIKVLKFVAGTRDKLQQLRIGLELVPRKGMGENKYAGYFIMVFIPVGSNTNFRYVPFCDAIGVSGTDFTRRTRADNDGNIQRIGKWSHDGEQMILAQLVDGSDERGNPRKEINDRTMMNPDEYENQEDENEDEDDDREYGDEEEYADDEDEGF